MVDIHLFITFLLRHHYLLHLLLPPQVFLPLPPPVILRPTFLLLPLVGFLIFIHFNLGHKTLLGLIIRRFPLIVNFPLLLSLLLPPLLMVLLALLLIPPPLSHTFTHLFSPLVSSEVFSSLVSLFSHFSHWLFSFILNFIGKHFWRPLFIPP